ncbi:retrotransposon protein, putative, ty1-copia subclass [Tanacetum coccineum]
MRRGMNEVGTIVLESFPSLPTLVTTSAGNAPGKSSYANITSKPSGKKLNIRTLFTLGGNEIDVVVLLESIQAINKNLLKEDVSTVLVWVKLHGVPVTVFSDDGLSSIATKLGTPLMLDSYTSDMCMQSWGRSSYARVMIELQADMELKDNIVVAMLRIKGEGHYLCNDCPKNTSAGEKKTLKKPSQTSRGVSIGPKMGFKPHKEYRHVPKRPNYSSSGNKKKGVEPTIEATSSGSSFMNFDNGTPIIDKIGKFDNVLSSGQAILVDNAGNPLKKVEFLGDYDSEDEVSLVDNDMARSLASEREFAQGIFHRLPSFLATRQKLDVLSLYV